MSVSINFLGQMVIYLWLASICLVVPLSYYFGLKKTDNPKAMALVGAILCFLPPFNFLYLMILVLMPKNFGKAKAEKPDPQSFA